MAYIGGFDVKYPFVFTCFFLFDEILDRFGTHFTQHFHIIWSSGPVQENLKCCYCISIKMQLSSLYKDCRLIH